MWTHALPGRGPSQHASLQIATTVSDTQACTPLLGHVCAQPPSARLHSQPQPQRCKHAWSTGAPRLRRSAMAAGSYSHRRLLPSAAAASSCARADSIDIVKPCHGSGLHHNSSLSSLASRPAAFRQRGQRARRRLTCASLEAGGDGSLVPLGLDFLTFLATTVLVIPLFKSVKASPVLGFLFSGVVLGQLGLFRNITEIEKLSELGVLFLLFEMGLELSLDRLKALAKYAFGLGLLQMLFSTAAFTLFSLPVGAGIGTVILERVFQVPHYLAAIRSVDEAVVIGVALSLSSSAFVLQLLTERGELTTKFGSATLGILLAQDIAVVPFLVLLPLVERTDLTSTGAMDLLSQLGPTALETLGSLGLLLLGGRIILRRVFEMVAASRSDETFVALCLLTVTGASLLTQRLGFSDTMGAFAAGVLLSETNFRSQVEADIRPFRSLLLGLFFVTTGSSVDLSLLYAQWPIVIALLGGLLSVKIGIIGTISQWFGLSKEEAIRTGFLLSQGGEFAFVLLSLAKELKVLPDELNRLLIIVVVLSMALTPFLTELGKTVADASAAKNPQGHGQGDMTSDASSATLRTLSSSTENGDDQRPIVICGFGELGQTVANMLESPLAVSAQSSPVQYIGFDMQPARIQAAREAGFNVTYGDASRPSVIKASGAKNPRAIAVVYTARGRSVSTVRNLRTHFPDVPIWARALDLRHAADLTEAGATTVIVNNTEAGTAMGSSLLSGLGVARESQLAYLTSALRKQMEARTIELVAQSNQHSVSESSEEDSSVFVISDTMYELQAEPVASAFGSVSSASSASLASVSIDGEYGLKQLQPEINVAGSNGQSLAGVSVDGEFGLKQLQPDSDTAGSNGQATQTAEHALTSQDTSDGAHVGSNGAVEERQTLEKSKL